MSANDNGYILFAGLVEIINKHLFMNASKTNVYTTVCAVKDDIQDDSKYCLTHRGFQLVQDIQTTPYGNSSLYTQPSEQQQQISMGVQVMKQLGVKGANFARGFLRNLVKPKDMQVNDIYVFLTKEGKEGKGSINATLEQKIYVDDSLHYILVFKSSEGITTTPVAINTSQMNGAQITFTRFILIMHENLKLQKKSDNLSAIQTEGRYKVAGGKRRYKSRRNKRHKRKQSKSKKQYKEKNI